MSFDGGFNGRGSSTLGDVVEGTMGAAPQKPAVRRRQRKGEAATVDLDLTRDTLEPSTGSVLVDTLLDQTVVVEGDVRGFLHWMRQRNLGPLVWAIAERFAMAISAATVKISLETDLEEDYTAQRIMLIGVVGAQDEHALDRLLEFTASPWWLGIVRGTRNEIVVDIERG
ncbi:MAG TPA: hypothetical protein VMJ10_30000 [Kofleriaceae bacterium]|nr:hypothetical protein [Kofleriaceae bacterium]